LWQQGAAAQYRAPAAFAASPAGLKAHAVGGFIKPGVSTYFEASPFKNGDVVFPGRIADPDMRLRKVAFQEVGPDLQRARTADRLNRGDAILLKRGCSAPNSSGAIA
jgi:hypothetical protein